MKHFNKGAKSQLLSTSLTKRKRTKTKKGKKAWISQSNRSYCKYVQRYTETFMTITLATYQCCVSKVCIHILLGDGGIFSVRSSAFGCHGGRKLSHCSSSMTALCSRADLPQTSFSRFLVTLHKKLWQPSLSCQQILKIRGARWLSSLEWGQFLCPPSPLWKNKSQSPQYTAPPQRHSAIKSSPSPFFFLHNLPPRTWLRSCVCS